MTKRLTDEEKAARKANREKKAKSESATAEEMMATLIPASVNDKWEKVLNDQTASPIVVIESLKNRDTLYIDLDLIKERKEVTVLDGVRVDPDSGLVVPIEGVVQQKTKTAIQIDINKTTYLFSKEEWANAKKTLTLKISTHKFSKETDSYIITLTSDGMVSVGCKNLKLETLDASRIRRLIQDNRGPVPSLKDIKYHECNCSACTIRDFYTTAAVDTDQYGSYYGYNRKQYSKNTINTLVLCLWLRPRLLEKLKELQAIKID